jgi:hypothetical protein
MCRALGVTLSKGQSGVAAAVLHAFWRSGWRFGGVLGMLQCCSRFHLKLEYLQHGKGVSLPVALCIILGHLPAQGSRSLTAGSGNHRGALLSCGHLCSLIRVKLSYWQGAALNGSCCWRFKGRNRQRELTALAVLVLTSCDGFMMALSKAFNCLVCC